MYFVDVNEIHLIMNNVRKLYNSQIEISAFCELISTHSNNNSDILGIEKSMNHLFNGLY